MSTTVFTYQHNANLIKDHLPLNPVQLAQLNQLGSLYAYWNQQINLISRKDLPHLYLRHILHSLSIAKIIQFQPNTHILDLGTGGGLPGIPLAIYFPHVHFTLIDSTGKKIKAVKTIVQALQLHNIHAQHMRAEQLETKYDFIVSRAVAPLRILYTWTKNNIKRKNNHPIPNGLLYLKGGDTRPEINSLRLPYTIYQLNQLFTYPFFQTKHLIHLFGYSLQKT